MSADALDISQLSETQQTALQTYTSVTGQDPIAAIPLLQRSEWNVQIAIARFFDGEPAIDPLEEARAAQASVPAPTSRHTANLQYESLLAAGRPSSSLSRRPPEDVVHRIDTTPTSSSVPTYRPPFLLSVLWTPFNILVRLVTTVLSPVVFLVPSVFSRLFRNLLTFDTRPARRPLPPADTARRFIREFEETYSSPSNPPPPWSESGFNLALDSCKRDNKFLMVVLISPSHDDTNTWVRETLLSSTTSQFFQSHSDELVLWGGNVQDVEGYRVAEALNCTKFPFVALICQAADPNSTSSSTSRSSDMSVVARATGSTTSSELTAKLGTAITAQQTQLRAARARQAEHRAQRNLRDEQDSAYERSLAQDRERARRRREEEELRSRVEKEAAEKLRRQEEQKAKRAQWRRWRAKQVQPEPDVSSNAGANNTIRVSIRLSDGERVIRRFVADAELEEMYAFVECYSILNKSDDETGDKDEGESGNEKRAEKTEDSTEPEDYTHEYRFRLVSPMPRTVYDISEGGTIANRVGKGANLIVEPIDDDDGDGDDDDGDEEI